MLRSFCHYLRGKTDDTVPQDALSTSLVSKVLSLKKFFKHLGLILRSIFPRFLCMSTFLLLFLLVDVVGLEFIVYQVGLLGGKFYKALTDKNLTDFKHITILAIGEYETNPNSP